MKQFEKGDIVTSPVNYRIPDGMKVGVHDAVVLNNATTNDELIDVRLFTHSESSTELKVDNSKLKNYAKFDDKTFLSRDIFRAVSKFFRKKGGSYDI